MGTLFSEAFTGTNGSAPSHMVLGLNPASGGGATIQGNRLDLAAGTQGGYAAADRCNRALSQDSASAMQRADVGCRFTYVWDGSECYFSVIVRSAQLAYGGGNGYAIAINPQNQAVDVTKGVSFQYTTIATVPFSIVAGTTYYVGLSIVGNQIKVYCNTGAQSATPIITVTDTSLTAAGYVHFNVNGGGAAGVPHHIYIDDLTVTDGAANQTKTITATVTPHGSIRRSGLAKRLGGQSVPTGGIFRLRNPQFKQSTVAPYGGIVSRTYLKPVRGTVTPTATYTTARRLLKTITASVTPTATPRRLTLKRPGGSVTPTHTPAPRKFFKPLRSTVVAHATLGRAKAGRVFGKAGVLALRMVGAQATISIRQRHHAGLTLSEEGDVQMSEQE